MKNKKFVIVDAMALAYKAYYAFINHPLSTRKGEPTSAVYGFATQLLKVIEEQKPDYLAIAFDSKEKTFRHDRYENYKSSRQEMPEDMIPQLKRIREMIDYLNIPVYIKPGYEADDLVGTAVKKAEKEGLLSYAITPDKDYLQLVTDKTKIVKPGRRTDEIKIYDVKLVKDEYGFEPIQMIDYLALIGDSSDDIPGVKGIGPKSALPLIQKYGSLENIYKHVDEIEKTGIKKKMIEGKESAFLSKELATIKCDVPVEIIFENARFEHPDYERLKELFLELEFKNLYVRLQKIYNPTEENITEELNSQFKKFQPSTNNYELVTEKKHAEKLFKKLSNEEQFVFDTETDALDQFELNILGASFSTKAGEGVFVAIDPSNGKNKNLFNDDNRRLPLKDFRSVFKPLFENKKIKKICQNGKFDIAVLRSNGIDVNNFYFDTMLASYIIDPDQKHGMDELSKKYLNYEPIPLTELIGTKKDPQKIYEANLKQLSDYASEDADITFRLYEILKKKLENDNLNKVAYEIEFPLVPVLEEMERTGIRVDEKVLINFSKELERLLENFTEKIYELAGEEFNINSTKQLQHILYDKIGLQTGRKTKTGYSTDARALESLRGQHDIIDNILEYRQLTKLKSTYADALPKLINPKTGRIHTTFNQTIASTGRLSSIDPNLQNIPIRTEMGREIRKAFVPRNNNYQILSADYSQIELRILASICGDEGLTNAFKNGEDIHKSTAALVFMVDPKNVTADMRRKAKEVNFGILYGIGPFGLKTRLGVTQAHAKEIIETYFNTFKRVKNYMVEAVRTAKEKGYAETILGRRRFLRNINSNNRVVRQFEERVAINMPIQGTAADMIKIAMINVQKEINKRKLKSRMVLQVHDELVFDVHKDEMDELTLMIKEKMEKAFPLKVPVVVDIGIGDNWLDAH